MITYLYWLLVIALAGAALVILVRMDYLRVGLVSAAVILFIGWIAYFFYFEQVFVKRYGGVMTINVPDGQHHIAATWKDDNLWVENYNPEDNSCHFNEYSRGNVLQGKVIIRNCNPLRTNRAPARMPGDQQE